MRTALVGAALAVVLSLGVSTVTIAGGSSNSVTTGAPDPPPIAAPAGTYSPPVDAPVIDPFRPPATPYGPGNRGLEYATVPGSPARAIGSGRVSFAGPVAGRGVVTVEHPDGLRSSLTGLRSISVDAGATVVGGQVLGTTAAALHLGVRRGDEYLDPAQLFASAGPPRHAVLVPIP